MKLLVTALFSLFLFQSCTMYRKTTLNLPEVEGKAIIINKSNQSFKFDSLIFVDFECYGLYKNDSTLINQSSVKRIKIEDDRNANEYENRMYVTNGMTSMLRGFNESSEYFFSLNYERSIYKELSGRLGFANSIRGAYNQYLEQQFYYGAVTYLSGNKKLQFEISAGYSLTHLNGVRYYGGSPWGGGNSEEVTGYYNYPLLEFGVRITNGPLLIRIANGWPFSGYFPTAPNISVGYAF